MSTVDKALALLFEDGGYLTTTDGPITTLRLNIYTGPPTRVFVGPIFDEGSIFRILTEVTNLSSPKKINIAKAGLIYLANERKTDAVAKLTNAKLAEKFHEIHLELEASWRSHTN